MVRTNLFALVLLSLLVVHAPRGWAALARPADAADSAPTAASDDSDDDDDESDDEKSNESSTGSTKEDKEDTPVEKSDAESKKDAEDDGASKAPAGDKADAKSSSSKSESPKDSAKAKKPDVHVVKAKKLKIQAESDGVFVAEESEEVGLRPEVWSTFKILEVVPHGTRVRKGDVLIEFDDRDIRESLEEKALAQRLGEVALMQAEEELPRAEKATALRLKTAERLYDRAVEEYDRFKDTMRPLSEEYADYDLKSARRSLDNAEEELNQLQKMYEADELTEETEEIVLRQHKFRVELAKFWVKYGTINHDYTKKVSLPERDDDLRTVVDEAKIDLERAKTAKSLGLSEKRYELESLRTSRARNVERHAKLVEDKSFMKLRAPIDGVVYYGRCINGRWSEVTAYESKLIPFATLPPNSVPMTVVAERPLRFETSVAEKDLTSVTRDQKAVLEPAADRDARIAATVAKVESIPGGGNQFTVSLELDENDLPDWIKPGMTAKAKITTYEADDAVVIPADLLQTDEEDEDVKYVMIEEEKGEDPVRRNLKLGKKKDKDVEILKGIEDGDRIVKGAKNEPKNDDEDDE